MQRLLDTLVMDQGYVSFVRKRVQFRIHRLRQATLCRHTYDRTEGLYTQGDGYKRCVEGKLSLAIHAVSFPLMTYLS